MCQITYRAITRNALVILKFDLASNHLLRILELKWIVNILKAKSNFTAYIFTLYWRLMSEI